MCVGLSVGLVPVPTSSSGAGTSNDPPVESDPAPKSSRPPASPPWTGNAVAVSLGDAERPRLHAGRKSVSSGRLAATSSGNEKVGSAVTSDGGDPSIFRRVCWQSGLKEELQMSRDVSTLCTTQ